MTMTPHHPLPSRLPASPQRSAWQALGLVLAFAAGVCWPSHTAWAAGGDVQVAQNTMAGEILWGTVKQHNLISPLGVRFAFTGVPRPFCPGRRPKGLIQAANPVAAQLLFAHREPVATVEVSCNAGESELIAGGFGKYLIKLAMSGVGLEQKCRQGAGGQDGKAKFTDNFHDAHVFGQSWLSIINSSLLPEEAVMSNWCNCISGEDLSCLLVSAVTGGIVQRNPLKQDTYQVAGLASATGAAQEPLRVVQVGGLNSLPSTRRQGYDVPEKVRLKHDAAGTPQPDGFVPTGWSQAVLGMTEDLFANALLATKVAGERMLQNAVMLEQVSDTTEFCNVQAQLKEGEAEAAKFEKTFDDPQFQLSLYPRATYLGEGQQQEVDSTKPNPACPLVSAGYLPQATIRGMNKTDYRHCREQCVDAQGQAVEAGMEGAICGWKADFGYYQPDDVADCRANRLSPVTVEGLYPACDGMKLSTLGQPEQQSNAAPTVVHDKTLDHRQQLTDLRLRTLRAELDKIKQAANKALAYAAQQGKRLGVQCAPQSSYRPVQAPATQAKLEPVWENARRTGLDAAGLQGLRQAVAVVHQQAAALQADNRVAVVAAGDVFSMKMIPGVGEFQAVLGAFNQLMTLLTDPASFFTGLAGKLTGGMLPVKITELSTWEMPDFSINSVITNMVHSTSGAVLGPVCTAESLAGTFGFAGVGLGDALGCCGTWGVCGTKHGYTFEKSQDPRNQALVAARACKSAEDGGLIQDEGCTFYMNRDWPPMRSALLADAGRSYRGSGVVPVGFDMNNPVHRWAYAGELAYQEPQLAAVFLYQGTVGKGTYRGTMPWPVGTDMNIVLGAEKFTLGGMANTQVMSFTGEGSGMHVYTFWKSTICTATYPWQDLPRIGVSLATGAPPPMPCDYQRIK
ncbi:MAG: hypothetical protein WAX89_03665 [Alphaproteobacteria bacterium]